MARRRSGRHLPKTSPSASKRPSGARIAAERLKAEVLGADRISRRRYIREFHEEWGDWEAVASWDDLVLDCWRAGIVYLGDYHALPASQLTAARLLADLAARSRNLALAVEVVRTQHQDLLDSWLTGTIGEKEFLRGIHYDRDWGYPWEGFRHLIATAQEHGVRVIAVDCDPRRGLRLIRKRDRTIAARIANIIQEEPDCRLLVHIGESHLASTHLPARVRESLHEIDMERRDVTVVQNSDEVYWDLVDSGVDHFDVVRVGKRRWCVFSATPLEKYEAYRRVLDRWDGEDGDEEDDLQPAFFHVVDSILSFLGVDKYTWCLAEEGICLELLVDAYPEVYGPHRVSEVAQILAGMPLDQIREASDRLARHGCSYVAAANAVFLSRFRLDEAAEEAGRFVWSALSGRLRSPCDDPADPEGVLLESMLDGARTWLASKMVHPGRPVVEAPELASRHSSFEEDVLRRAPLDIDPAEDPAATGRAWGLALAQRLWLAHRGGPSLRRKILELYTDPVPDVAALARRARRLLDLLPENRENRGNRKRTNR